MYVEVDSSWFLIFRHNITEGGVFKSKEEAKFSLKKGKFSLLSKVDDSFKVEDKFEFLLRYPPYDGYQHWTQKTNPLYSPPGVENHYAPIQCSWSDSSWHGLSLSSDANTLIDGSPFDNTWFYSIGMVYLYNKLPGPRWEESITGGDFNEVNLYLRLKDPSFAEGIWLSLNCSCRNSYSFISGLYTLVISLLFVNSN